MATKTTPTGPRAWRPDVTAFVPSDVVPDALILSAATVVGSIEGDEPSLRVPYVVDDSVVGFVPEATGIPDANQQFSEVIVQTGKIAALGKYSFEILQQPRAAELVVHSLNRSVTAKGTPRFSATRARRSGCSTSLASRTAGRSGRTWTR